MRNGKVSVGEQMRSRHNSVRPLSTKYILISKKLIKKD
jgi:hypothetical protein